MTRSDDDARLERLVREIEPRGELLRSWPLAGGISARMTAFEIAGADGGAHKLILRRHRDQTSASDEYRLLQHLRAAGLPVPTPRFLDQSDACLVLDYIEGAPDYAPVDVGGCVRALAMQLADIHRTDIAGLDFLARQEPDLAKRFPSALGEPSDRARIRAVLEAAWPLPGANDAALLHGDFWPGNLLWRDGRLVAVIDWEDAALGDPLADLAISRLDVAMIYGADAMAAFTQHYVEEVRIDVATLPYWDLRAAQRAPIDMAEWGDGWPELGRDDITERSMREGHGRFVAPALAKLDAS